MHLHQVIECCFWAELMTLHEPSQAQQGRAFHGCNAVHENRAVVVMELAEQGEGFKEFGWLWQPAAAVVGQHKTAVAKVFFDGGRW